MSLTNSPYWFGGGVDGFYPTQINDSLRFDDGSSAYLNRTPASAGNRKTWTFSAWIKLSSFSQGERGTIFQSNYGGPTIYQDSGLRFAHAWDPAGTDYIRETVGLFRDPSAWYHVVWWCDTTQAGTRWKIYVNGTEQTLQTPSGNNGEPAQNTDLNINSTNTHTIGNFIGNYFDGYMAEVNFIDGQALDASSFGEAKDGTWIPKSYSGSYGTNGFHLEFNGNSNDTSGNSNNWTANNISAHDYVPDSPTNNFATFNPLDGNATSYSEGNLRFVGDTGGSYWRGGISTFGVDSGKWYWEMYAIDGEWANVGIMPSADQRGQITPTTNIDYLLNARRYIKDGTKSIGTGSNRTTSSYGASWTTGDIISVALDMDAGTIVFYKNGSSQGTAFTGISGVQHPHATGILSGSTIANFGQDSTFAGNTTAGGNADGNGVGDFKYSVPSGFLALCSANLPEPTIIDASENFNTLTWTGNGSNPRTLSGLDFAADFIWHKSRSNASMSSHAIQDVVRGFDTNNNLYTNLTGSQSAYPNRGVINSVSSTGYTVNENASDYSTADGLNENNQTFVSWNWKAGGTAVSNDDGSITTQVSANTDAGFSIFATTSNPTDTLQTYGHGLNQAPELVFIKTLDSSQGWLTYHKDNGFDKYMFLNDVIGDTSLTDAFANVTDTVVQTRYFASQSDIVGYCWHSVDGYSKVGSYIGGGSNFPFIYTGFRPSFILIKSSTYSSTNWLLFDNKRGVENPVELELNANNANQEYDNARDIDFVSNGFKIRSGANNNLNTSGGTYIYLAFGQPFKYANAR